MRRRLPWWLLALLFLGLPILEIYILVQLGQTVGIGWTLLILIADAALGSWLVRREGGRAWGALQVALQSGRMPARELADGALILIGGTLLMTPGFVSDVFGLFCILPFTRPVARRVLARVITRRLTVVAAGPGLGAPGMGSPFGTAFGPGFGGPGGQTPTGDPRVVPGEVVDPE